MLKSPSPRRDRDGNHRLSGGGGHLESGSSHRVAPVRVSLLGAFVLLGPLTLLGEWLIAKTHHRPLGAATFASCTILAWMLFEGVSRVLFAGRDLRPAQVRATKRLLAGLGLLFSVLVFARALI